MDLPRPEPGDFATVMDQLDPMRRPPPAHPFGTPVDSVVTNGRRGRSVPARQTTKMFYCPKQLDEYDEVCNRGWAGEIEIRYERNFTTKEGEMVMVVCYLEHAAPQRPAEILVEGNVEPEEMPRKLP